MSRVILKREKGNITLFAFDEGQGLSEHTSPFDALVQVVEGEAEITVAGKPIALKQAKSSCCLRKSRTLSKRPLVSRCC